MCLYRSDICIKLYLGLSISTESRVVEINTSVTFDYAIEAGTDLMVYSMKYGKDDGNGRQMLCIYICL